MGMVITDDKDDHPKKQTRLYLLSDFKFRLSETSNATKNQVLPKSDIQKGYGGWEKGNKLHCLIM